MLKFELLKKEDIIGENCLSIFKKIHVGANLTDVARHEIPNSHEQGAYWLDSYHQYFTPGKPWEFKEYSNFNAEYVTSYSNLVYRAELNDKNMGIRLKVAYDNIKDEIIEDFETGEMYSYTENGVKVILALELPQRFLPDDHPDNKALDILYKYDKLKKDTKTFPLSESKITSNVYYYKTDRYVRIDKKWAIVEPIEWYYDEETQTLVSKNIILAGIPFSYYDGRYVENLDFNESIINKVINKTFAEASVMDLHHKEFYFCPLRDTYNYYDELKKLNYWENYKNERTKRKQNLEKFKQLISTTKTIDELQSIINIPELIDKILELNKEDEELIENGYPILKKL